MNVQLPPYLCNRFISAGRAQFLALNTVCSLMVVCHFHTAEFSVGKMSLVQNKYHLNRKTHFPILHGPLLMLPIFSSAFKVLSYNGFIHTFHVVEHLEKQTEI